LFEVEIFVEDIEQPLKKNAVSGNMRKRVQLLDGTINWQYTETDKYSMQIKIPVNNKEAA
jgi:hypothetical protein